MSFAALQKQWAKEAKAKQKSSGGGNGIWDTITGGLNDVAPALGLGNLARMAAGIPGGLVNTFVLGPAHGIQSGDWSLDKNAAKGLLYGAENTISDVTNPVSNILGSGKAFNKGWAGFNKALTGQNYVPRPVWKNPEGLAPGLANDLMNVSVAGAGAGAIGRTGTVGALADEAVKAEAASAAGDAVNAAKASAKAADRVAKIAKDMTPEDLQALRESPAVARRTTFLKGADIAAHPLRSTFNQLVRPVLERTSEVATGATGAEAAAASVADAAVEAARRGVADGSLAPEKVQEAYKWGEDLKAEAAKTGKVPERASVGPSEAPEAVPVPEAAPAAGEAPVAPQAAPAAARLAEAARGVPVATETPLEAAAREAAGQQEHAQMLQEAFLRATHGGEPTVTLYRGEPVGEGVAKLTGIEGDLEKAGRWFTTDPELAAAHAGPGGHVMSTEVPQSVAAEAQSSAGHVLPPEWAATAKPVEAPAAGAEAPPVPGREPVGPTLEGGVPQMKKLAFIRERPTPPWAIKLVDKMPKVAVDFLAATDRLLRKHDESILVRQLSREVDAQRAQVLKSDAFRVMRDELARPLVGEKLDTGVTITAKMADEMVGAEVMSRMTGAGLQEMFPDLAKDPVLFTAVNRIASNSARIPDSLIEKLGLEGPLDLATELMHKEARDRLALLESSGRLGNKGLENVDANEPILSPMEKKLLGKIEAEVKKLDALFKGGEKEVAQAQKIVEKTMKQVAKLQEQIAAHETANAGLTDEIRQLFGRPTGTGGAAQADKAYVESLRAAMAKASSPEEAAMYQQEIEHVIATPPEETATPAQMAAQNARMKPLPGETPRQTLERQAKLSRLVSAQKENLFKIAEKTRRVQGLNRSLVDFHDMIEQAEDTGIHGSPQTLKQMSRSSERITRWMEKGKLISDNPSMRYVPAKWQPVWEAIKSLHKEAENDPVLAAHLGQLPETFGEVIRTAMEKGFDPSHVRDFSPNQVEQLLYGRNNVAAGLGTVKEEIAGTRRIRTSGTPRTQSIGALAAARDEVVGEAQRNELVSYYDKYGSVPVPSGGIPKGWELWDPVRNQIINGKEELPNTKGVRVTAPPVGERMIPTASAKFLRRMGKDYSHPILTFTQKITNPWRMFVLSLSPRWYVHTAVGTTALSILSGARMQDFIDAWRAYREDAKNSPERVFRDKTGYDIVPAQTIYHDAVENRSLTGRGKGPRAFGKDVKTAVASEDLGRVAKTIAPVKRAMESLTRVHDTVNRFNRAATYSAALRQTGDTALALQESSRALVDYGDLTPFEQSWVRAIVPFWSWQKGVFKILARVGYDHPVVFGLMNQLSDLNAQYQRDKWGTELPFGYQGVTDVPGLGTVNLAFANPFMSEARMATPSGIADAMNPFLDVILRSQFGATDTGRAQNYRMDNYGRLVPDVPISGGLADLTASLPVLETAVSATGGQTYQPAYGEGGFGGTVQHYLGSPAMPPSLLKKVVSRTTQTKATLSGTKLKKPKTAFEKLLSRNRKGTQFRFKKPAKTG